MPLYHPIFVISIFLIAYFFGFILKPKKIVNDFRYQSIDGIRGILAIGVFIHHASIWRVYGGSGQWLAPNSDLFLQLGTSTVYLFFMITSFLFISKLIINKNEIFDWSSYFKNRFLDLLQCITFQ
jgi:peptidoglycan/LPS O-acetylase OafA/YrhL